MSDPLNINVIFVLGIVALVCAAAYLIFGPRKCLICEGRGCARCGGRGTL